MGYMGSMNGHMFDQGFNQGIGIFGLIPIFIFLIWLVFLGLSLYVLILVIKALKKYINSDK